MPWRAALAGGCREPSLRSTTSSGPQAVLAMIEWSPKGMIDDGDTVHCDVQIPLAYPNVQNW